LSVHRLEEMSTVALDALDRARTIIVLTVSPLEEHGPHLPVGVDAFDALPQWTDWLKTHGFEPQRPLVRMVRKASQGRSSMETQKRNGAAAEMRHYSIFGPEFA